MLHVKVEQVESTRGRHCTQRLKRTFRTSPRVCTQVEIPQPRRRGCILERVAHRRRVGDGSILQREGLDAGACKQHRTEGGVAQDVGVEQEALQERSCRESADELRKA